jgi:hypothetical protein
MVVSTTLRHPHSWSKSTSTFFSSLQLFSIPIKIFSRFFLSAFDFSHFVLLETGLTWIQDEGSYPEHRWATSPIINFIQVDYIQLLIQIDKYEWTLICIFVCWFRFYLSWNSFVFLNLVNLSYLISCLLLRVCWVWLIVTDKCVRSSSSA